MLQIEIHQSPVFVLDNGKICIRTDSEDQWTVILINGNLEHTLDTFDGFRIFSKKLDQTNQLEKATQFARFIADLVEISYEQIKVYSGKTSRAYLQFKERCNEQKEQRKRELKRQLSELES